MRPYCKAPLLALGCLGWVRPALFYQGEHHGAREDIRIVWLRDGKEAASFQVTVRDAETASRLFDRLVDILRTETAGWSGGTVRFA